MSCSTFACANSDHAPSPEMTQPKTESHNTQSQRDTSDTAAMSIVPTAAGSGSPPIAASPPSATPPANARSPSQDAGTPTQVAEPDADSGTTLCSGCDQEKRDPMDMTIHLHHVHINAADIHRSSEFYKKFFHAEPVVLNGVAPALHVAPTFILLDETNAPDATLPTALQHMGWGADDPGAWYTSAHAQGIEPDTRGFTSFETKDTPTIGEPGLKSLGDLLGLKPACFPVPDSLSYMYVLGPDQERIEVWTGANGRVNHLHFTTADLASTAAWYDKFLDVSGTNALVNYSFFLDDIVFYFEPIGAAADYKPTDDHVLGHFALAVSDLDAWRKRAEDQSISIVTQPAAHGFSSFFVRGPDGMLIELVQAAKYPELCPPL